MGETACRKPDFPAAREIRAGAQDLCSFADPTLHSLLKGAFPSGLSQQNRARLPILGSWRQQQMANRHSKLIKPPNVLRFVFQIHWASSPWPLSLLCIIFTWQHCPALTFPSLAQAKEHVHCISISTSQNSRDFCG